MGENLTKFTNKIRDGFNNLSNIQKLVLYVVLLIFLIVVVYGLSNVHIKKGIIDYKNFNFISVKEQYLENEDRMIYLYSEEIINNLIATYFGNYSIDGNKVKIGDYYENVMYIDFKNSISKGNFRKIVEELAIQFKNQYNLENPYELKDTSIIEKIYIFDESENMYMIETNLNNNQYFIGIKIVNGKYTIYYIGK